MSGKKDYDEVSVKKTLQKINGVTINGNKINVNTKSNSIGNGTWGKIDYLCKNHGYTLDFNEKGNYTNFKKNTNKDTHESKNTKFTKRVNKLNMAELTRAAMKSASIE